MPGKGSKRFAKALKTASSGHSKRLRQARHIQRSMERQGKSKQSAAKAAMAAAKGHLADGMSLEAALEKALVELELPGGLPPEETPHTPYPQGLDPRPRLREPGERTAFLPPRPMYPKPKKEE